MESNPCDTNASSSSSRNPWRRACNNKISVRERVFALDELGLDAVWILCDDEESGRKRAEEIGLSSVADLYVAPEKPIPKQDSAALQPSLLGSWLRPKTSALLSDRSTDETLSGCRSTETLRDQRRRLWCLQQMAQRGRRLSYQRVLVVEGKDPLRKDVNWKALLGRVWGSQLLHPGQIDVCLLAAIPLWAPVLGKPSGLCPVRRFAKASVYVLSAWAMRCLSETAVDDPHLYASNRRDAPSDPIGMSLKLSARIHRRHSFERWCSSRTLLRVFATFPSLEVVGTSQRVALLETDHPGRLVAALASKESGRWALSHWACFGWAWIFAFGLLAATLMESHLIDLNQAYRNAKGRISWFCALASLVVWQFVLPAMEKRLLLSSRLDVW